jgi:predicted transcriptional regulator
VHILTKKVNWIRTSKSGARTEFTDADILTALHILNKEAMGRYKLQEELNLSDSSTKSLLKYFKSKKFVETAGKRKGHKLTRKGKEIFKKLVGKVLCYGVIEQEIFPNKKHYFICINGNSIPLENQQKIKSSWEQRDIAIAYGAEAILFLTYKNGQFNFPEKELDLESYYPQIQTFFEKIKNKFQVRDYCLISAANNEALARKSAFITVFRSNPYLDPFLSEII